MKKLILISIISLISLQTVVSQRILSESEKKMANVMAAVKSLYVDTVNEGKIADAAITAMMKELDPHSVYIPKEEVEKANEPLQGSFEGVGIQFQMFEDTLLVVQTVAGCPAEKVGVLPGDRIIYIDDENIAGVKMQNSGIMKRLRGTKGTEVVVKVMRKGQKNLMTFRIIRDKIPIHSVDASYMIGKDIGYIKINNFGSQTVPEYLEAFSNLKKEGMKHLILSLQGNGGGYLNAAIQLADEFLERNKLIVYTEGLRQPKSIANATALGGFEEGKLIILIDEYSASASEIVTGAIQDWDRGIVIGRRSFGKGLVQRPIPLIDGSMLRLTTARYYTPSGRCIQKSYENGDEDYAKDLSDRYKKGELMHADSIHFPDSLRYKTLTKGRTVYGGGGIMPDIFVPLDTNDFTSWHRQIVAQGIINKFTIKYIEAKRDVLKQNFVSFKKYDEEFCISESELKELRKMAEDVDIKCTDEEYKRSSTLLALQLKAIIARDLFTANEFYKIMDTRNESLQEAINLLRAPGLYEKMLK